MKFFLFNRLPPTGGLLGTALLMILAACSPSLREAQPLPELPERFSADGTARVDARWWQSFNDPELNRLTDLALSGNFTLQGAEERLNQAQAVARKAGADLWPALDLAGSAGRTKSSDRSATSLSLNLSAAFEIDLWGRLAAARDAAAFELAATTADLQVAALTVTARVAETWFALLEERGRLRLLEEQLDANRQIRQLILVQVRTGKTGISDLLQQEQFTESLQGDTTLAAARIEILDQQLSILCGVPPDRSLTGSMVSLPELPPLPATGLPAELIRRRPDLRKAYAEVQAADRRLAAAIADRFPRLSLTAGIGGDGDDVRALFDNWLANLAANLVAPLVDGGQRRAEVDRSAAAVQSALYNFSQTTLTALGEVEEALSNEAGLHQYVTSLDRQLDYSDRVLANLRERYLRGATSYQRVLDALITRQRLEQNRLQARSDQLVNRIALYRALNGGWQLSD